MSTGKKPNADPPAIAGGALGVEYVGQIDGASYQDHLSSPDVQAVIESARKAWLIDEGSDPVADRLDRSF